MSSKRKKRKRRGKKRKTGPNSDSGSTTFIPPRRVPRPKQSNSSFSSDFILPSSDHRYEYTREAADNPVVQLVAPEINRVSRASRLAPFVVLSDWFKMMEATMALHAENMKSVAMTGKVVKDPPDVAAIFRAARNRYLAASQQHNPSVYRMMQDAFIQMYVYLVESRCHGLHIYASDSNPECFNPDIVGQIFLHCLDYPAQWHKFFPSWASCQALAKQILPDPHPKEISHTILAQAALDAAPEAAPFPELVPGSNWKEWLHTIAPYIEPFVIPPHLIQSSPTMLLALAARFDDWEIQNHMIHFIWQTQGQAPLLGTMCHLNARLYGLNGNFLEHIQAAAEIAHFWEEQDRLAPPPPATGEEEPPPLHPAEDETQVTQLPQQPPKIPNLPPGTATFTEMFQQSHKKAGGKS